MTEVNDRNRFSSESWLSIQDRFRDTSPRQKSMIVIYDSGRMKSIIVVNDSNWFSSESGLSAQDRFQSTSPRQKCETRQAPAISAAICCIGPAGFISGIIAADAVKIIFFFETQPFSIFKPVSEYYSVNINTGAQKLTLKRWQRYRIFIRQSRKDARINMVSCQMILHWNDQNVKFSISPKLYHWGLLHRHISTYVDIHIFSFQDKVIFGKWEESLSSILITI